ncbi:MAG: hypothetical protein HOC27_00520 [Phycisphaerae bacterium]|jgi:hypothetical protein|nr:hypothetical protein [Phycisphaerae bacterium]
MAAPTKESPFITVVLKHDLPDGTSHFDWLLSVDAAGEKPLVSFRVTERPDLLHESRWVDLDARPDHRPEYLHIEGQLEGDRGKVERLAKGSIFMWKEIPNGWSMMVQWKDGELAEFELLSGEGVLAFRRIFEDQSQEPPPPLPKPKIVGDVPVESAEQKFGLQRKITAFGGSKKKESSWSRTPNSTGTGAAHVRTFHSKLTDDALGYVDTQINAWLDDHPEFEVKLVTTTIGTFTGKVKEPHLICQVWV